MCVYAQFLLNQDIRKSTIKDGALSKREDYVDGLLNPKSAYHVS